MKAVFFSILFCYCAVSSAQNPAFSPRHDYIWLTGYDSYGSSPDWGGTRIDFATIPPTITREDRPMNFDITDVSMSDEKGKLIFYTDGYYIANALNNTLLGGERINPDESIQNRLYQGVLALPLPGNDSLYYLVHEVSTFEPSPYSFRKIFRCLYSVIDMRGDNGLGEATMVNQILLKDTLCYGKLTACKHANGRDWWVLIPKWNSSVFFTFLLTPSGWESYGAQQIGPVPISNAGQAVFSPDGSKYVKYNAVGGSLGAWLDIYDFDRCTGLLSNCRSKTFNPSGASGVAISSNSRYLYFSNGHWLYQYDLHADDILSSEILLGTYDGYMSPVNTFFFLLQLAPDGKIYMNSAATVNTLHVIHRPDLPGAACRFEQHGVQLPTLNNWSMPNFPNYRLGPLDGSPCDTLGLDNLPAAHFRWEFWDTLSPLHVYFTDLSVYDPAEWHWDFGDGATGAEKDPGHTYAAPGVYTVCLSVRNAYGSNTACYPVNVGAASAAAAPQAGALAVSALPNPFRSALAFSVPVEPWQRVDARLYDLTGRAVARTAWRGGHSDWKLEHLPAGIYWYELTADDGRRGTGKVLKE